MLAEAAAEADIDIVAEADVLGDVVAVVVLEVLDEQAARPATTVRPSTGPARSRRFVR
jgi:hypothetical protein